MQSTPQDNQLMSKHRVLSFKPQLRLEWRGQDGQNETEQPDHSASLGDSIASSTRIRFSVHTGSPDLCSDLDLASRAIFSSSLRLRFRLDRAIAILMETIFWIARLRPPAARFS